MVIGRLSQALKLITTSKSVFKLDVNLDFNLDKTMFLTKGTTGSHVYERTEFFLQNDPSLQDIVHDFTFNMFSVEGIEILGTPIDTDTYIKEYVKQNCLKIIKDTVKHDPLTDGFVHFQLMKFCVNTRTQYMSAKITLPPQEHFLSAQHVHVDTVIADAILRKGTRGSFRQWDKNDYDLTVTRLQMPHTDGGFGLTPNTIAETSAKGDMTS